VLRGLMALGVAFYHFTIWYPAFQPGRFVAATAAKVGHYGVEGFFIISGFCFFHLYRAESFRGGGLARFHLKRFLRIAPLYYLAAALDVLLGLGAGPPPGARILVENATFTFGLVHPNHALGFGLGLALTVLLAAWTHRWVERPAMNWGRKLTARP